MSQNSVGGLWISMRLQFGGAKLHKSFTVVTLQTPHLHQISRAMAHQYREAVGPWAPFLGVMKCAGHSD